MGNLLIVAIEGTDLRCLAEGCVRLTMEQQNHKHIPIVCECSAHSVKFYSELRNVCVKT